jgi:hypothetical protein
MSLPTLLSAVVRINRSLPALLQCVPWPAARLRGRMILLAQERRRDPETIRKRGPKGEAS